MEIVQKIFAVS